VLATSGDNHLGGDDFDERITNHLLSEIKRQHRTDLRKDLPPCSEFESCRTGKKRAVGVCKPLT
jgi:molecular chaperone DnaK